MTSLSYMHIVLSDVREWSKGLKLADTAEANTAVLYAGRKAPKEEASLITLTPKGQTQGIFNLRSSFGRYQGTGIFGDVSAFAFYLGIRI